MRLRTAKFESALVSELPIRYTYTLYMWRAVVTLVATINGQLN